MSFLFILRENCVGIFSLSSIPGYPGQGSGNMATMDEQILRTTKEIVVKFIESGRISPSSFHESFKDIFRTVENTTKGSMKSNTKPEKGE